MTLNPQSMNSVPATTKNKTNQTFDMKIIGSVRRNKQTKCSDEYKNAILRSQVREPKDRRFKNQFDDDNFQHAYDSVENMQNLTSRTIVDCETARDLSHDIEEGPRQETSFVSKMQNYEKINSFNNKASFNNKTKEVPNPKHVKFTNYLRLNQEESKEEAIPYKDMNALTSQSINDCNLSFINEHDRSAN